MSVSQVRQELGADGFRIERVIDVLPWQHIIVLAPASPPGYANSLNGLKTLSPGRLKSRSFPVTITSLWRRAVAAM